MNYKIHIPYLYVSGLSNEFIILILNDLTPFNRFANALYMHVTRMRYVTVNMEVKDCVFI